MEDVNIMDSKVPIQLHRIPAAGLPWGKWEVKYNTNGWFYKGSNDQDESLASLRI